MMQRPRLAFGVALGMGAVFAIDMLQRRRRRSRGAKWNAKEQCWEVEAYDDVCELLSSDDIRANYLPSFLAQLPTSVPATRYAYLADFFQRWPLFQDGKGQRRT